MSMISELVNELRIRADVEGRGTINEHLMTKAADTIEMLSEKARESKQGKWIVRFPYEETGKTRTCSNCYITQTVNVYNGVVQFKFCPYCGAMMKGASDERL